MELIEFEDDVILTSGSCPPVAACVFIDSCSPVGVCTGDVVPCDSGGGCPLDSIHNHTIV